MVQLPESLCLAMTAMGDPEDPATSSGWPAAVLGGLREVAAEVVAVGDTPEDRGARAAMAVGALIALRLADLAHPGLARARLWNLGRAGAPYALARTRKVKAGLRHAGRLDGLVQNGGDYRAPAGMAMVTYQDSTVAQAVRAYPWPHLRGLSPREIDGLVRRQRDSYRSAVGCCTFSHWVAESIVADYGIPQERVHVAGLGSNGAFDELAGAEREWGAPRFLFVGFDWTRKNGDLVLQAFAKVREQSPAATLDLVGGHPPVMLEGVRGHGLLAMGDPDQRARLTELYRRATAFVMPSIHEPAGTVHVEAAAAGIPSIGTRNGGAATCIGPGGYVVDPGAPGELLEAMLRLCDAETARRLGELGRVHSLQFTWRKVAERLVRALRVPGLDTSGLAPFLEPLQAARD